MIVQCQGCKKKYNIAEKNIPAGVKQARCKICGGTILLNLVAPKPKPASLSVKARKLCPKCDCQLDEKQQNECPTCGIVFTKYNITEARRKAHLINCRVCKKKISKSAESCPNCGEPLNKKQQQEEPQQDDNLKQSQTGFFGCLILIGFVFIIFVISILTSSTSNKPDEIVSNSAYDASVYQVENYLNNTLKDPDSFEAIEWSPVQKTDTGYMVRCKYRAKNSFGGYVIADQIFILNKKGIVVGVIEN